MSKFRFSLRYILAGVIICISLAISIVLSIFLQKESLIVFFAGIVPTILLALFSLLIIIYTARVETLMAKQAGELKTINEELKLEVIEHNLIDEQLKKTNEFNEILVKTIPFAMDIVDSNGCILYMDEKTKNLLGIKEVSGKKCFTLYRDDKEQCRECPLRSGISVGETETIEVEGVLGGRIYSVTHTGMMYQGKKAILEIFEDITERKEIENQLKKISSAVEHSPSMVIITDKKGDIEYINPKFTQLTGYTLEEMIGKNTRVLKSGENPPSEYSHLWEIILTGKEWRGEFHNKKKNGELYWELASISSIKGKNGKIINFVKVAEDITERRHLEEIKDEFVNTVSHEMRTPLSIMREGVSQVMEGMHGGLTERQNQVLSMSLKNIDRLGRIINDLLNISKIEAGKVEINRESLDIVDLAKKVSFIFYSTIKNKGLELRERYPKTGVEVFADKDRITQVFTNLIDNAIRFTEKGCIEVFIEDKEEEVICSVGDTGIGIAENDMPKVFSKFEQFGRIPGPGEKGTGLGLAISKGIIDLHNGKMWVESKLREGTKFIFTLPK